jgi:hypothetical protein
MALIRLNSETRNGKPFIKEILVNTEKISVPVREVGGKAVIGVNELILENRGTEKIDIVEYVVTESLDYVIQNSSYKLFKATVLTRESRVPSTGFTVLGFSIDRVVGNILEDGRGSKFLYHEDNTSLSVEFVVEEILTTIMAQLPIPLPTSPTEPLVYKALLTQQSVTSSSGVLIVGKDYLITTLAVGDDFTNVGYVADGVIFTATGIGAFATPTNWTNGTVVIDVADSAPTAIVLNAADANFLGFIGWSYLNVGFYLGTLSGAFIQDKYSVVQGAGTEAGLASIWAYRNTDDTLFFQVYDLGNVGSGFNLSDNILVNQYVLIEVYP